MSESLRITAKHRAPEGRGNAYDVIARHTGLVWVKPGRSHAAPSETFAGRLEVA